MTEVHSYSTFHLPAGYDDNRIVLLARDPHWLFAYWEISDKKRKDFFDNFGYNLWEKSVPVLKVTNISKNESFYIRIDNNTNSWYINVDQADSLYVAELGRLVSDQFFINLSSSNYTATPSTTVSSDTNSYFIDYRQLKNSKLNIEDGKIYHRADFKLESKMVFGLSSPELFGIDLQESIFGVSSAELFGINIEQHLGISSESFIK